MRDWTTETEKRDKPIVWAATAGLVVMVVALIGLKEATEPTRMEAPRASGWPKVRAAHLEREPACAVCGETENVEVHHVVPYHLKPELELSPENLLTLCGPRSRYDHHRWFAHFGDSQCHNPDVRKWVKAVKERKRE